MEIYLYSPMSLHGMVLKQEQGQSFLKFNLDTQELKNKILSRDRVNMDGVLIGSRNY
jgi:hypothetical protein